MRNPPLRLDDRFTHLVFEGESVVLVAEDDAILLEAPIVTDVIRLLDGRSNAVQIAHALADRHAPELVHFTLLGLESGEITRPAGDPASLPPERALATGDLPGDALERLAIRLSSTWRCRGASRALLLSVGGSGGASDGAAEETTIVVTDDYLRRELAERVQEASEQGSVPVVLTRLGARRVWIGPSVGTAGAACLHCLQERLRLNLAGRALVHMGGSDAEGLTIESLDRDFPAAAYRRLAAALHEMLEGRDRDRSAPGMLGVLHVGDETEERHPVSALPHCGRCGDPTLAPPGGDVELASRRKLPGTGGGYRTLHPRETLDRFTPLVSPLTGVVTHIRRVDVEGTDIVHVYTAGHAREFGAPSLGTIRRGRRDPAGGKGRTDLDARVSALCESLERFSSVHRASEPCRVARASELGGDAILPQELLLFSQAQYAGREEWNAKDRSGMQWVPQPYHDEVIEWSPVRSLTTGLALFAPSSAVYLAFRGEGRRFCKGDSNGLSGGNHPEEAVLQGLLELAERDAVALWWYNRARRPAVDLASFEDAYVEKVAKYYLTLDRSLWALDLTTDLGIPCFVAISAKHVGPSQEIVFGFGAHIHPGIALSRAVIELNQILVSVLRSPEERRSQLLPDFEVALRWWDSATLDDHPHLRPADPTILRRLGDFVIPTTNDLLEDVVDCVSRVRSAGCDVFVHDLTRAEVGLSVVRVLAPGLRHFWRRLGPGRLYDVPPRLGWIQGPLREEDMNPTSMFV